jgi:hypothetical protein
MTRRHGYVRGAVVTLWSPEDERVMLIKRVIGLPGDWVRVPTERNTHRLQHVPPGQVWVEGDGTCSRDSTSFGPVPLALLTGQVAAVIWPPWRAQTLTAGLPAHRYADDGGIIEGRPKSHFGAPDPCAEPEPEPAATPEPAAPVDATPEWVPQASTEAGAPACDPGTDHVHLPFAEQPAGAFASEQLYQAAKKGDDAAVTHLLAAKIAAEAGAPACDPGVDHFHLPASPAAPAAAATEQLYEASKKGDDAAVTRLLAAGADPNAAVPPPTEMVLGDRW